MEFIVAVRSNNYELVKKLIEYRVYINFQDKYGNTALIYASRQGNKEICNLLINYGADINIQNKYGHTALNHAIIFGSTELSSLLIKSGTDISGYTPLMLAVMFRNNKICEMLIDVGAELDVSNKYYKMLYEKKIKEIAQKLAFNRRKHLVEFYYKDFFFISIF